MRIVVAALIVCAVLVGGFAGYRYMIASDNTGFVLITAEEAGRAQPRKVKRMIQPVIRNGPEIVFHAPSATKLNSPVDFDVEFRPRGGIAPDVGTLKVEYDLGIAWLNITKKLLAHAKVSGTRLSSKRAQLPGGNHVLRMTIRDKQGRESQAILRFSVN